MKIFLFFINSIFWLWLFLVPACLLGLLGYWLFLKSATNLPFSIFISVVGVTLGVVLAEYVRKHYGLDNFFGRLLATPDIDGGNILDEKKDENEAGSK